MSTYVTITRDNIWFDVLDWLEGNIGPLDNPDDLEWVSDLPHGEGWRMTHTGFFGYEIMFDNDEDALFFKLRWM